jgi:O-antigen/teichoic acid export membrane protein
MSEVAPPQLTRSIAQRIANGSFWSILGTGSGRVMNLIAMLLAARLLGAEGFGAFALVQSTLGLFGMFAGAALGATATRFIAATHRTDPDRTGRVIGLVSSSALVSALIFGAAIVVLSPWLAQTVLGSDDLALATALGALLVGFGVLRGVQDATLAGFEAFRQIAFLRFMEGSSALLLIPLLVAQFGPAGGIAALSFGLLLALLPGIGFARRELRDHGVTPRWRGATTEWRLLRDFSAPSLLANTVATPVLWVCMLLLSRTPSGLAELGVYNAAYQWHGPLVFVPMAIASVSLPILTQSWAEGDRQSFRRIFIQVLAIGTILALTPALLLAILSPQIMRLYGEEFRTAEMVLVLLVLAAPLHVASVIGNSAIQSMNQSWYLPGFHCIWGVTLLVLAVLMIDSLGAEGLALAFLASYCILSILKVIFVLIPFSNRTEPRP